MRKKINITKYNDEFYAYFSKKEWNKNKEGKTLYFIMEREKYYPHSLKIWSDCFYDTFEEAKEDLLMINTQDESNNWALARYSIHSISYTLPIVPLDVEDDLKDSLINDQK